MPYTEIKTYFTGLKKSSLKGAVYAVLPGDPKRAEELAMCLDPNATLISINRQHLSLLANVNGNNVLVVSTGMGCAAITVTVEELAQLGVKYFIRVGTCGTIQEYVNIGDIVITSSAVKLDNTSLEYAPESFPAVPSFDLTDSFIKGAKKAKIPYHTGITASSDTFWPGQERHDNYSGYLLRTLRGAMDEWRALNVVNFEMEASALFTVSYMKGVDAACFCGVIAKRTESEKVDIEGKSRAKIHWETVLKSGLCEDMKKRGLMA